jgi:hypothetical protein
MKFSSVLWAPAVRRIHELLSTYFVKRLALVLALALLPQLLPAQKPAPRVERTSSGSYQLKVDGQPFLILGAQVANSSGWKEQLERAWPLYQQLHANTAEIPVYWEVVEPEEGRFDFSSVDMVIEGARVHQLHLVLLWFATWKNGEMDYVPTWVKENPARFPHMSNRAGEQVRVLTPLSTESRDADKRAFAALMHHIKEVDGDRHTVIMVQVENEPGSLETDRDYSPEANRLFEGPVPAELTRALGKPSGKSPGNWRQVFGSEEADEAFAAYYVASYVNAVAAAGKKQYDLPLYVNVWLRERKNFERPGDSYPSGGATSNMLDLWKAVTPAIDAIGPDNYVLDYAGYRSALRSYARPDNPLFVPETIPGPLAARYMFYALGEFHSLSFAPFGLDLSLDPQYASMGLFDGLSANYRLIGPAVEEIARLQQTNAIQVAVEEDRLTDLRLTFAKYESVVTFGTPKPSYGGLFGSGTKDRTGRALGAELAPDEFLIGGFDASVKFLPRRGSELRRAQFAWAEEGDFEKGVWKQSRLLNGDELFFGITLPATGKWVKVKLISY